MENNQQVFLIKNGAAETAFEIRNSPIPVLADDEVLIKVHSFGLNFADVMARRGLYREAPPLPCVLGYEAAGTVVSCNNFPELEGKKVLAFCRFNGYSRFLNVKRIALVEINDIDFAEATALATQYVTAWYASNYITTLHKGERVLIHAAAGGVGSALVQMAKNKGCEVFALVGSDAKIEYLKSLEADHIINYKNENYTQAILKILDNQRLDLSFNPVAGASFKKDLKLLGSGGRLIMFGGSERNGKKWGFFSTLNFVRKMGLVIPITLMMRSKSIMGVNMLKIADFHPQLIQDGLQFVVDQVEKGCLQPKVDTVYNVNEIALAHQRLESGKSIGKVVIKW